MARIISYKTTPTDKVKISVVLDKKEALALKGRIKGIYIFCAKLSKAEATMIEEENELYLSVPYKNLPQRFKQITCQRIELKDKDLLIYACQKIRARK